MGFWDSFKKGFRQGMTEGQPVPPPEDEDRPVLLPVVDEPVLSVTPTQPDTPADRLIEAASGLGLDVMINGSIEEAHRAAGPIADAPPLTPGRQYRIVDVPGSWARAVVGSGFSDYIESIPFGPVFVTLRFEPNDVNAYGISAYVNGKQVGWLQTEWTATDRWVVFMRQLDDAGILPRFMGIHRLTGGLGSHIINFDVPGKMEGGLKYIAARIIEKAAKP